jgi:hypothetical protein
MTRSPLLLIAESFHKPCWEPKKRLFEGRYQWAHHRFPIKGGISTRDVMARDFNMSNPLWEMLIEKPADRTS